MVGNNVAYRYENLKTDEKIHTRLISYEIRCDWRREASSSIWRIYVCLQFTHNNSLKTVTIVIYTYIFFDTPLSITIALATVYATAVTLFSRFSEENCFTFLTVVLNDIIDGLILLICLSVKFHVIENPCLQWTFVSKVFFYFQYYCDLSLNQILGLVLIGVTIN